MQRQESDEDCEGRLDDGRGLVGECDEREEKPNTEVETESDGGGDSGGEWMRGLHRGEEGGEQATADISTIESLVQCDGNYHLRAQTAEGGGAVKEQSAEANVGVLHHMVLRQVIARKTSYLTHRVNEPHSRRNLMALRYALCEGRSNT